MPNSKPRAHQSDTPNPPDFRRMLRLPPDATRIPRHRSQTGDSGKAIGGDEHGEIPADRSEELGTEQRPETGHALDHRSMTMPTEPAFDAGIELNELSIERQNLLRESADRCRGSVLPRTRTCWAFAACRAVAATLVAL